MVNKFNDILYKFSNNIALQNSEIEYLKELLTKYPYFKLSESILFANQNTAKNNENSEITILENTDNEHNINKTQPISIQSGEMEIIKKFLKNPCNFYDLLK
jgi:hypothetical protein